MQEQIVIIFVIGHAVSILLTPFANYAADLYGQRVKIMQIFSTMNLNLVLLFFFGNLIIVDD